MTDTNETPSAPPPGWYLNPEDPSRERWWDGQHWTEHQRVLQSAAPPSEPNDSVRPSSSESARRALSTAADVVQDTLTAKTSQQRKAALATIAVAPHVAAGIGAVSLGARAVKWWADKQSEHEIGTTETSYPRDAAADAFPLVERWHAAGDATCDPPGPVRVFRALKSLPDFLDVLDVPQNALRAQNHAINATRLGESEVVAQFAVSVSNGGYQVRRFEEERLYRSGPISLPRAEIAVRDIRPDTPDAAEAVAWIASLWTVVSAGTPYPPSVYSIVNEADAGLRVKLRHMTLTRLMNPAEHCGAESTVFTEDVLIALWEIGYTVRCCETSGGFDPAKQSLSQPERPA